VQNLILRLRFSNTRQVLHFCMWNFIWADKAQLALSAQTNFHIQKCNTCRVFEKRSRALEVSCSIRCSPNPVSELKSDKIQKKSNLLLHNGTVNLQTVVLKTLLKCKKLIASENERGVPSRAWPGRARPQKTQVLLTDAALDVFYAGWAIHVEVLNVKVHMFVLLLFASLPDCSQNQTAVSDTLRLLSDF
jgi:hypothetical protein